MTHSSPAERLKHISNILLTNALDFLELKNALDEMKELLWEISKLEWEDREIEENIHLDMGCAIGPKWAGMCLEDILRTKRFAKGVYEAVSDLRKEKPNKPVHILYIGTGPFATLVLPLLSRFSPSELQLELLEVNKTSFESVQRVLKSIDAMDYLKEIHHGNALQFKSSDQHQDVDIVIVECLQHALIREPQVAIVYHLLPQLREDVILIPEDITLSVSILDYKKKEVQDSLVQVPSELKYNTPLASVFSLNKQAVEKQRKVSNSFPPQFSKIETPLDLHKIKYPISLGITTEITVYKKHVLTIDESGLTVPLILEHLKKGSAVKAIATQYTMGDYPKLETTLTK